MPVEILLSAALALLAAGALITLGTGRRGRALAWVAALVACAGFAATGVRLWLPGVATQVADDRPREVLRDGYVSSSACRSCHPRNYATWRHTWHRTMTQVARARTALGRFDGVTREIEGRRYRMWSEDGALHAAFSEPGEATTRAVELVLSTGSHHMQVYWYPTGAGRPLAQFPLVWVREAERWLPRNAAFVRPPVESDPDEQGRWNSTCIKCHTTRGRPRLIDLDVLSVARGVRSEAAELGIACEACHGPGARHVEANRDPVRRYRLHLGDEADPTIVNPARLTPERAADVCGQCHSVFTARDEGHHLRTLDEGYSFVPGDDLEASRRIVRHGRGAEGATAGVSEAERALIPASFWPDGMVRVSGREYNALTDSPCFIRGDTARGKLTCISCHRLHQDSDDPREPAAWANDLLDVGMRTNAACTGCHENYAETGALARHTRHEPGGDGGLCYNCHMPPTTFGLLKAMRSHTIDSPSAAVSAASGRPLACNLCHLDRSLGWSAGHLADWYGHAVPELATEAAEVPASIVALLSGDAAARALAAWSMAWPPAVAATPGMPRTALLARVLDDPYDAVRYIAARAIADQPEAAELDYDFLAPAHERRAARRRLTTGDPAGMARLGLRAGTLAGLAAGRDDRPVLLAE